jgi:hypothetical protein
MKRTYFLIAVIFILVVTTACSRLKVVPEISDSLSDVDVMELTDKPVRDSLVDVKSGLLMVTEKGELFRWSTTEKMVNFLYNVNREIEPGVFLQGDFLALLHPRSKVTVFDLKELKEIAFKKVKGIDRLIGVNEKCLIFQTKIRNGSSSIGIMDYQAGTLLKSYPMEEKETVFNSQWRGDNIYIMSSKRFYSYNTASGHDQVSELKYPAASAFLLDGDRIYYGSENRYLLRLSLNSHKVHWKFKLPDVLRVKPCKVGPYIAVVPEDNILYFYNRNGTLHWWEKLGSTLKRPPVALKDNAAVFLWNQKVKFFDYKKKRVITYPLHRPVKTNLVPVDGYIYTVTEDELTDEEKESGMKPFRRLSKIGNHYGVEINTVPRNVKPLEKSIKFNLKPINLIEPSYRIKISRSGSYGAPGGDKVVFEKSLSVKDKPTFVWVPKKAEQYRLVIEVDAENKKGVQVVQTFEPVDIDRIVQQYFYELQSQSDYGIF